MTSVNKTSYAKTKNYKCSPLYQKSIFTRDLRRDDNLALLKALSESKEVLPIFIFTPTQTKNNSRFSSAAFGFNRSITGCPCSTFLW